MGYKVYVNGNLVPEDKASISVFDRSFLYGEGAFETIRAYDRRPAFCDMHYHRLKTNCDRLKFEMPLDEYAFKHAIVKTINANKLKDAYIRITVSPIGASIGLGRPAKMGTNFVIFVKPFKGKPQEVYDHGGKVVMIESVFPDDPEIAKVKSTNYLSKMLGRMELTEKRADEGLVRNRSGLILEGTATNLFLVKNGTIFTPPLEDGCLPGITRWVTIGLTQELGIECVESHVVINNIIEADEIFLTGSTIEVLPIREVVGVTVKESTPGPVTKRLMTAYSKLAASPK